MTLMFIISDRGLTVFLRGWERRCLNGIYYIDPRRNDNTKFKHGGNSCQKVNVQKKGYEVFP